MTAAARLLLAPALLLGSAAAAQGADAVLAPVPGGDFRARVQSMEERRFLTVVRQRFDFSCGSAALATLLHYHYGIRQAEEDAFRGMWAEGDRDQIRRLGFSLLDMKRYLSRFGLSANGFKVGLDEIAKAATPGIALITINNFRHFVVVKGVNEREVLVGDPSLGLRVMPRRRFEKAWNGVFFVIDAPQARDRARFNDRSHWAGYPRAPLGSRFADPLSQQVLALTAPFYRDF